MGRISGRIGSAWTEIIRRGFELPICGRGVRIGEILYILEKRRQIMSKGGAKVPVEGNHTRLVVESNS